MKSKPHRNVFNPGIAILLIILMAWSCPHPAFARLPGAPTANVGAVQGEAQVFSEDQAEPKRLASGAAVDAWNTINTSAQSRLFLNWDNGLMTSLGDTSSLFVSVEKRPDIEISQFQVIEGIVRVATKEGLGAAAPYAVLTPAAAVEPDNYGNPVDLIVESYDPTTTTVTVLAGNVKVSTGGEGGSTEKMVSPCSTVYVNQAKKSIDVVKILPEDAARLVSASTLPGTMGVQPGECTIAAAAIPPSPPPAAAYYPPEDYYYIEDSEPLDFSIYDDITVLPPRAGVGCAVVVPGIGQFMIPFAALGNWACDPVVVLPFARRVFFDQCFLYYQDYWRDLYWRRNELHRVMYLAQLAGNTPLVWKTRHELDYLNVRLNWANRRIHQLERRVSALEEQQQRVSGRLPRGLHLSAAIGEALTSRANVQSLDRFQKKLKNDRELQNRLANLTGQEVVQLRSRLGQERDPQKRLAMRNGLTQLKDDVAQGKLPLPAKKTEIRNLVGELGKTKDPAHQERIEGQLLNQLKRAQTTPVPNVLEPATLTTLQKELNRFPNPDKRGDLEKRLTEMQQSLDTRRETEATRSKAEELATQAAREKNPERQQELLGKLKDLSVPLAVGGLGAVGLQQLRQQQQNVQKQLTGETDQEKKASLQRTLEGLKQRETGMKQLEEFRKGRERVVPQGEELKKQQDLQRRGLEEQRQLQERERQLQQQRKLEQEQRVKQPEQLKQQEQLRLQQEKERQTDLLRRQQEERDKKDAEIKRQEQLKPEQEKARQEQLKLQQEKTRQDQLRLQQERGRQEQLKLEQEKARQEQLKLQQEKTRQDQLRLQQEKSRQEQQRLQQDRGRQEQMKLEQEKVRQQQLQQQQDKARQQQLQLQERSRQQQLQQQQDKARQDQLRLQQERGRQEQMKLQQERGRQEQMRLQQERGRQQQMKLQQDQARQQALRQQQDQARQQAVRQQQDRARQEQLRLQKLKEEEEKRKKQVR